MTVKILSLSARDGDTVAVTFALCDGSHEQKETFLLSAACVADLRLARGETTRECYDAVAHASAVYQAVRRGMLLLGYGACSERALCRKLTEKGVDREIAREAVSELTEQGYLNASADALREAERCVAKGWGKRRIVATLFSKGYSDESVRDALNGLEDAGVDFVALCAKQLQKRVDVVPSDPGERRKLIAALERYGYSVSEIREAFHSLTES